MLTAATGEQLRLIGYSQSACTLDVLLSNSLFNAVSIRGYARILPHLQPACRPSSEDALLRAPFLWSHATYFFTMLLTQTGPFWRYMRAKTCTERLYVRVAWFPRRDVEKLENGWSLNAIAGAILRGANWMGGWLGTFIVIQISTGWAATLLELRNL